MSREIKFRAWALNEDKNCQGWCFYDNADCMKYINDRRVEITQFTGLKDKNGKEVFENDIISTPHFFNWTITGYEKRKVFFKDGAFGVKENEHSFIALKSLFKGVESSKTYISNYGEVYREFEPVFEVIGNIYQNPELLGGEND